MVELVYLSVSISTEGAEIFVEAHRKGFETL